MKRSLRSALLALLLLAALVLQGCVPIFIPYPVYVTSDPSEADASRPSGTSQTPTPPEESGGRYTGELVFGDLAYTRPDAEAIIEGFDRARELVLQNGAPELIVSVYDEAYQGYIEFDTMNTLAYIRYTLDLSDEFYHTEYVWCEEQSARILSARSACDTTIAGNHVCKQLETLYFGDGYFDRSEASGGSLYSDESIVALLQEEARLEDEYMALEADVTVTVGGRELSLEEALSTAYSNEEYAQVYRAYYEKYNPIAAEIYIRLVRVRKQIAAEAGYDSYADLAYDYYYDRDYTPAQARQYTAAVAEYLAPRSNLIRRNSYSAWCTSKEVLQMLGTLASSLGGQVKEAYDYMQAHELIDLSVSATKLSGSYMTYLTEYEMPFVYVSPTGDIDDILTAAHEFGHFVDGYVNYNTTYSIDCNEIFSQGMEFLALSRIGLSDLIASKLARSKLADSLSVFLTQACFAEFEDLVYNLSDEALTAETLNKLFADCAERFHVSVTDLFDSGEPSWIDINHFFIAPYYVISYCISGDAALQIYQAERADGTGFELYTTLLSLAPEHEILSLLEAAGMQSPFAEGRMEELAEFFRKSLG